MLFYQCLLFLKTLTLFLVFDSPPMLSDNFLFIIVFPNLNSIYMFFVKINGCCDECRFVKYLPSCLPLKILKFSPQKCQVY